MVKFFGSGRSQSFSLLIHPRTWIIGFSICIIRATLGGTCWQFSIGTLCATVTYTGKVRA